MNLELKDENGIVGTIEITEEHIAKLGEILRPLLGSGNDSASTEAQLKEKEEYIDELRNKVAELESLEHKKEVIAERLRELDSEEYMNLGIALGHSHLFVSEDTELTETEENKDEGSEWQGMTFADSIPENESEDDWTYVKELGQFVRTK